MAVGRPRACPPHFFVTPIARLARAFFCLEYPKEKYAPINRPLSLEFAFIEAKSIFVLLP